MTALSLAVQMAILMFIGFFARKKRIVEEKFSASLASFIFNFVFPCVVINAMQIKYEPSQVLNSGLLIGVSIFTMALMLGLGLLVNMFVNKKDDMSRILLVTLMFTNFTYMAFPIMESLYGEKGSFYIAIYTIPVRVLFYVVTPLIFTVGKNSAVRLSAGQIGRDALRAILSPPVLAVPVGLVIYLFGITLPGPIDAVIASLAKVATPMGMVLCGVTLAAIPLSRIWKEQRIIIIAILRLIAAPAIAIGIYYVLSGFVHIDPLVAKVSILYCALPAAATTTVMAIKSQSDATRAAQCVFVTTIFSVLTLPAWSYILEIAVR